MTTIEVYYNNDKTINLQFNDSTGSAIDITGWTVRFTVKDKSDLDNNDTKAVIKKDVTSHSDPTNGQTSVTLTDTDTSIEPQLYKYDIKFETATGSETTFIEGDFKVLSGVTNR